MKGERLSYGELNRRANQLGHYLRKQGVGPEVRVGICVERSLEMVVGMLGILKAGGAYVPLDPEYPEERLEYMVEDAQAAGAADAEDSCGNGCRASWVTVICAGSRSGNEIEQSSATANLAITSGTMPRILAYVIYTSGSTGQAEGSGE